MAVELTFESFAEGVRKTTETPPRVSVYDTISKVKGCSGEAARMAWSRLVKSESVPVCEEVAQNLIATFRGDQDSHGGARRPVLVATAQEMVQILFALPGSAEFRKNCAQLVVRYLGGDLSLVEEVFRNRAAQERLAAVAPEHPGRVFGETVEALAPAEGGGEGLALTEAGRKRLLDDMREMVRDELRQNHVWSFSKRSRNHRELMGAGQIVHGDELRHLDEAEHIVRVVDFLTDRIEPAIWRLHGRKFKNIYAAELKRAKMRESRDEGLPPLVAFNQAEYRILYTEADYDLMVQTLADCRERFEAIAGCDRALFLQPRRGRQSIRDFMRPRDDANVAVA